MKIICIEEHTSDHDLLQASLPKQKAEASYFTEVGDHFKGDAEDGDDKLPMTVSFGASVNSCQTGAKGASRRWTKHRIDMQRVSYSNPSQNAPVEKVLLSFLNGERTPDLPNAQGSMFGLAANNVTSANMIRVAVEGRDVWRAGWAGVYSRTP